MKEILITLLVLQFKHLIIDWIMQPPYMWRNKGIYGHVGGIAHAGLNGLSTAMCFLFISSSIYTFWLTSIIDFLVHYHIDWAKMNITRITKWGPTTHAEFWWLTGFDQFLHQVTYIALALVLYS